jgi:hypothetical protein
MVASPAALDELVLPAEHLLLRMAKDEALILPPAQVELADPHAIIVAEGGFAGIWLSRDEALDFLERHCEWELPKQRPAFAQGMVAGISTKIWFEQDRILLMVPTPYAHDFGERLSEAWVS